MNTLLNSPQSSSFIIFWHTPIPPFWWMPCYTQQFSVYLFFKCFDLFLFITPLNKIIVQIQRFWGHNTSIVLILYFLNPYVHISKTYIKFFHHLYLFFWVIRSMGTDSSTYGSSSTAISYISGSLGSYTDTEQTSVYMNLLERLFYTFWGSWGNPETKDLPVWLFYKFLGFLSSWEHNTISNPSS